MDRTKYSEKKIKHTADTIRLNPHIHIMITSAPSIRLALPPATQDINTMIRLAIDRILAWR